MQIINRLFSTRTGIFVLAGIVAAIVVIKLLKFIFKKKENRKELRRAAADRARDENLNNFILNTHNNEPAKKAYVPYDVDYSNNQNEEAGQTKVAISSGDVMVQLVEKTELSTRKFVLSASKGILVGTDSGCDISFISDDRQDYKCEIIALSKKEIFVRDLGHSRVFIRRKKNQAIVDDKGIKVMNGDVVILGKISYTITIVN